MPRAGLAVILLACLTPPLPAVAPPPRPLWVVVVAPAFRQAVVPLIEQRRANGLRVEVVPTDALVSAGDVWAGRAGRLQQRVHALLREHAGPGHVLLVGAVAAATPEASGATVVPPLVGSAGRMRGQPTDAPYGCLDTTRLPSAAVGRFPARSVAEVEAMVAKTLAYERGTAPGAWKRRLTVLAGVPAYNPVADRLIEAVAFARLERLHPVWLGRALYTSESSRFALPPRSIRPQALDYLRRGQAFILYLGHSDPTGLYAGPTTPFLDRDDWGRLSVGTPGSVLFTFGCNGCQLAGRGGEGYGVAAMRNPHGPAAVFGSHGVCYAAMVQLAVEGLIEAAFRGRLPMHSGDCWLAALRGLAGGKIDYFSYRLLDSVDGDPNTSQAAQRQEHLEMFVLLGDPALRLPQVADDLTLQLPSRPVVPGQPLELAGELPPRLRAARVQVLILRTPASVPAGLEAVPAAGPPRERALLANHRRANDFVLARAEVSAVAGRFAVRLPLPAEVPGTRILVRVRAWTDTDEALTAALLPVHRPSE